MLHIVTKEVVRNKYASLIDERHGGSEGNLTCGLFGILF